jgi:hypothetical protein
MMDLFGNDSWPTGLRPPAAPVALNLFAAAAETQALATGRARSTEHAELFAPAGLSCLCGTPLRNARADCPNGCK